jgi:uncharacterized protein
MRQAKREIIGLEALEAVIKQARICRLALYDVDFPYIVPMNFGYTRGYLYFHCAREGKKLDLIRRNNRVGFEMEAVAELLPHPSLACAWASRFESVVGCGRARILNQADEQRHALDMLMRHASGQERLWKYPPQHLSQMLGIEVAIESMTGKRSKHF